MDNYDLKQQHSEYDQRQIDLTNHALSGVEKVMMDVTRLMAGAPEVYALLLSVAGTLVRSAGAVLKEDWEKEGRKISDDTAVKRAMVDLINGLGLVDDGGKR